MMGHSSTSKFPKGAGAHGPQESPRTATQQGGYLVGEGKEACLERVKADYTGFWVLTC